MDEFWTVLGLIIGLIALFAFGFTIDPKKVPSPLVGKPAPEKVMEYAQMAGMILLFSLLVYANGNDLLRLF